MYSRVMAGRVIAHIYMTESWHTYNKFVAHIWQSHGTHTKRIIVYNNNKWLFSRISSHICFVFSRLLEGVSAKHAHSIPHGSMPSWQEFTKNHGTYTKRIIDYNNNKSLFSKISSHIFPHGSMLSWQEFTKNSDDTNRIFPSEYDWSLACFR